MISVSLKDLLLIPPAYHLAPEEFRSLMAVYEDAAAVDTSRAYTLTDRTGFGVVADLCEDRDELELAFAFRWLMNRDKVAVIARRNGMWKQTYWELVDLPQAVAGFYFDDDHGINSTTLAYRIAGLATQLERAKGELT